MRIAVIEHAQGGDYTEYLFSLLEEKANQHNYQVKFWSNSVPVSQQHIGENAVIFISLNNHSSFFLNWLYQVKIPSIVKKIKAEVVVGLNGMACPRIKVPQLIAAGPGFLKQDVQQPDKLMKFARNYFDVSQKTAAGILSYSNTKKPNQLLNIPEKIQYLPFTAPTVFKTFEWHEKIMTKAQFADNKEYFISVIEDESLNDFVLLLKGFSRFKKWQQSNMQLIILPKYESFSAEVRNKLCTYKYRDDVQLLENAEEKEIPPLFASAHSFIHVAGHYPQLYILSIAMQCSLPVISFQNEDVKEYGGDGVLFCDEKTDESLGNSLIQLYKNENLHAQLKEAAGKQALSRNEYGDKLWQLLEVLVKKN
ncbi:glycosyltransferase [Parafilimonas sp.]|uniref:glycosyltransferase n=1 Tax=Parafilimonas sp. TaxID=1969739 RepID=UPI0039E29BE5